MIKQFEFWKTEAEERENAQEGASKIADFESYLIGLNSFLGKNEELTQEERIAVFNDIELKLNYILEAAKKSSRLVDATKHLLAIDYKTLTQSMPQMDREHALYLFKSFLMPLPD